MSAATEARVIVIDVAGESRFFYGFGNGGRLKTAWCLAGAKLFQSRERPNDDPVPGIIRKVEGKGYKTAVLAVRVDGSAIDRRTP